MLNVCTGLISFFSNSFIIVSSTFADLDSLTFLLCPQSSTITSANTIMANTVTMARLVAERVMAKLNLESVFAIIIDTSFSLSDTTPVSVWSVVVKWSTFLLPSDSVVLIGSFIVITEAVVNGETSGMSMIDDAPIIVITDGGFVPPDGSVISFVCSTVDVRVMFDVTVEDGLTAISSIVVVRGSETVAVFSVGISGSVGVNDSIIVGCSVVLRGSEPGELSVSVDVCNSVAAGSVVCLVICDSTVVCTIVVSGSVVIKGSDVGNSVVVCGSVVCAVVVGGSVVVKGSVVSNSVVVSL